MRLGEIRLCLQVIRDSRFLPPCFSVIPLSLTFVNWLELDFQKCGIPGYLEFKGYWEKGTLPPFPLLLTKLLLITKSHSNSKVSGKSTAFPHKCPPPLRPILVSCGSVPVRAEKDGQNEYPCVDKRRKRNIPQTIVKKINRTY